MSDVQFYNEQEDPGTSRRRSEFRPPLLIRVLHKFDFRKDPILKKKVYVCISILMILCSVLIYVVNKSNQPTFPQIDESLMNEIKYGKVGK